LSGGLGGTHLGQAALLFRLARCPAAVALHLLPSFLAELGDVMVDQVGRLAEE
jgi:hypothetical protein